LHSLRSLADFYKGETDAVKVKILGMNPKCWNSIRSEVSSWVIESWPKWEREKPAFFNKLFKESLDDDMLPPAVLRDMKMAAGGGTRRRSSMSEKVRAADPTRFAALSHTTHPQMSIGRDSGLQELQGGEGGATAKVAPES
jgi:hypothetical protein